MNSMINSGALIGSGSVVASGAVVRENAEYPAGTLIAGVPAKTIRTVDETLRRRTDLSWPIYRDVAKASLPDRNASKANRSQQFLLQMCEEVYRIICDCLKSIIEVIR